MKLISFLEYYWLKKLETYNIFSFIEIAYEFLFIFKRILLLKFIEFIAIFRIDLKRFRYWHLEDTWIVYSGTFENFKVFFRSN
jgi:hypothetical protein